MNRLSLGVAAAALLALAGCKQRLAPHVTPEADPEILVADAVAADNAARASTQGHPSAEKKITLTINNAPGPEQTLEHDILQQMVDLFEKRHPNIRIQFSPWRYTPESFFERAHSRGLTDVVEVDYSQIPPILDLNYAADITDLTAGSAQLADVNPELMAHLTRNGRLYGIPGEMHTMALFYNRKLVDPVLHPHKETKPKAGETKKKDQATSATSQDEESSKESSKESSSEETESSEETKSSRKKKSGSTEKRKGRGADDAPREYLTDEPQFDSKPVSIMSRYTVPAELSPERIAAELPSGRVLAQYQGGGVYYADPQSQQAPPRRQRYAQPQSQGYYPPQPQYQQPYYQQPQRQYQQPQQPQQRRGFFGWLGGQQAEPPAEEMPPQQGPRRRAPAQYDPFDPSSPGYAPPGVDGMYNMEPTPRPRRRSTTESGTGSGDEESTKARNKRLAALNEDVLTSDPEELTTSTQARVTLTTVVQTADLPQDWDSFIRLATKLTDHATTPTYGYAPILFAKEGGREFAQWAIQAGLQIQVAGKGTATLDVNTTSAAMVAQFLKDLHWRYDITPPPGQCYADNIQKMFVEGRVAMVMLPADRATISRLIRLGFPLENLGIAPLPGGPANRKHLGFGSCYIVNSQLDQEHREAALQWLLFQLDPEVIRMRRMTAFREQEWTGIPEVPIYRLPKYEALTESLRPYYNIPLYPDYYRTVASGVGLEPPYFTARLYEALAEGIRPIVENKNSDPIQSIAYVGADFEKKYLQNAPTPEGIRRYLNMIPGL